MIDTTFREIYVDIDSDFQRFEQSKTCQHIRENMKNEKLKHLIGNVYEIYVRKSSSGNVHLRLDLENAIDVLEMFELRALFHDDTVRIAIDLRRLVLQGEDEINRIFSSKFKDGVKYEAGEWKMWYRREIE